MPIPFSIVNEVAREEFLSGDLVNSQTLASAQAQDLLRDDGRNDESRVNPTSAYVSAFSGDPITPAASLLPDIAGGGGFSANIGRGQGFIDTGAGGDLNGGDSSYLVLRWEPQTINFTAPDPANPRIDLVYAAPNTVQADTQSRNILLDPIARTVAPALIPKRLNPTATLVVVAGTPGVSPTSPALPANSLPVFEVFVPAAAPSSASFLFSRQANRRCTFPMSSAHGILQGCELTNNMVDEATTTSNLFIGFSPSGGACKLVIDGEVVAFESGDSISAPLAMVQQDAGGNNPFAAAAPATNDKPYFIYACGGRHLRQGRIGAGGVAGGFFPACVVESLVGPTRDGRPSAAITTPRGVTQAGAVYIGVGFVVKGTTNRKACIWAGDWVYPQTGQHIGAGTGLIASFNDAAPRVLSTSLITSHVIAARPASATLCLLGVFYSNPNPSLISVGHTNGTFVMSDVDFVHIGDATVPPELRTAVTNITPGLVNVASTPFAGTAVIQLFSKGFNMLVKRYTASV